jgi:hypothetical protein
MPTLHGLLKYYSSADAGSLLTQALTQPCWWVCALWVGLG